MFSGNSVVIRHCLVGSCGTLLAFACASGAHAKTSVAKEVASRNSTASPRILVDYDMPPQVVKLANETGSDVPPPVAIAGGENRPLEYTYTGKSAWARARKLELIYQALGVVDTVQTVSCLRREACWELNPIYGKDPSTARVIGTKVAGGIAHYLITRRLVSKNSPMTKPWQYGTLALQGGAVVWNLQHVF